MHRLTGFLAEASSDGVHRLTLTRPDGSILIDAPFRRRLLWAPPASQALAFVSKDDARWSVSSGVNITPTWDDDPVVTGMIYRASGEQVWLRDA